MKNKNIKLIICSFLLALGMVSCETTELELLQDPTDVTNDQLDPDQLFNSIQLDFDDFVQNTAGDASFTAQVTRSFAMTGGNQYVNAFSPSSFNTIWSSAYAGVLADINTLEPIAEEQGLTYQLGVAKIMKAYVLFTLVDMFGDVPYSEALLGNGNLNPNVDSQTDVYSIAFAELDEAIAILGTDTNSLPSNDLYYPSTTTSVETQATWITVAKSLKLRTLNNIRLNGAPLNINVAAEMTALINENDLIDTPAEDWQFNYGSSRVNPDARHRGYDRYYENGALGYMSNYLMWTMIDEKNNEDPRLPYYFYRQDISAVGEDIFTLGCQFQSAPGHFGSISSIYNGEDLPFCTADAARGYWGRDHGDNGGIPPDDLKRTVYGVYPVGGKFDEGNAGDVQNAGADGNLKGAGITPIILSSYINFIKAEAQLILGVPGDARTSLENGIRESMSKVNSFDSSASGMLASQVNNYIAEVLALYDASGTQGKLDVIMKEYFIASFGNGLETYNGYRRTGFPSNYQPTLEPNPGAYYRSALYPADYVNNNVNATQKDRTEQVFWDTNPAGFIY